MNNKEPERFLNGNFDEDLREGEQGKLELKENDGAPPVTFNGYDACMI